MKRMRNSLKVIILIFILIIFILLITNYYKNKPGKQVCINLNCFDLEIAQTDEERARGLMFRSFLPENQGMLFIFEDEDFYSFWMKNTLIPLDIIWISRDLEIVHLEQNVQPCKSDPCPSYTPNQIALYVLEINGGLVEKYNFNVGDKILITNR